MTSIGWFHLRPDRIDAGEQELGYRLRRVAWGRGLATEGSLGVLAHGFGRVGAAIKFSVTRSAWLARRA